MHKGEQPGSMNTNSAQEGQPIPQNASSLPQALSMEPRDTEIHSAKDNFLIVTRMSQAWKEQMKSSNILQDKNM